VRMSWRFLITVVCAAAGLTGYADARSLTAPSLTRLPSIVELSPTLAPFQHVRFCLRYPTDCKSSSLPTARVELDAQTMDLLRRVNREVNLSIAPTVKNYGSDLTSGWTIAPKMGDCNDYAVTKRHSLLESGLPSAALRLSVIRTASGVGHLVLLVSTTKGDFVLDNLTEVIRPWQLTEYDWIKIQSAKDPRFWNAVSPVSHPLLSQAEPEVHLAGR
jgi:predicted transglutaminase-like cysteine proteinase